MTRLNKIVEKQEINSGFNPLFVSFFLTFLFFKKRERALRSIFV